MKKHQSSKIRLWDLEALALYLPYSLGFLFIYILPFGLMLFISFSTPAGHFTPSNYGQVLQNEAFQLSLLNLLSFMLMGLPTLLIISYLLSLAVHFTQAPKWVKLLLVLPIALPSGASIGFFKNLFGASYDSLLYGPFSLWVMVIIFIWKYTGYNLLIFLSGFKLMRSSILDSAKIDGASFLQIVWHIVLPLSAPYILFASIVSIVNSFKIFKEIYILQGSYPNTHLYLFQHFVNNKFTDMAITELSAAATLFAAVILATAFSLTLYQRYTRKRLGGAS